MRNDFLEQLLQIQDQEERSWFVIEYGLGLKQPEIREAIWAAAVPHWFNADVLAMLCPDHADQVEEIYAELQTLSYVEEFEGRGHRLHDLTRAQLLTKLWERDQKKYQDLSARAVAYFSRQGTFVAEVESLYHLMIADPEKAHVVIPRTIKTWARRRRVYDVDWLIKFVREHVQAGRSRSANSTPPPARSPPAIAKAIPTASTSKQPTERPKQEI